MRITIDANGCWIWNGTLNENGYGVTELGKQPHYVHRVMYQLFVEPLNKGREIDHLCRVRRCCNPKHLEAVTSYENSLRGNNPLFVTHRERRCRRGHDLTIEENVRRSRDGRSRCRPCALANLREWRKRRRRALCAV